MREMLLTINESFLVGARLCNPGWRCSALSYAILFRSWISWISLYITFLGLIIIVVTHRKSSFCRFIWSYGTRSVLSVSCQRVKIPWIYIIQRFLSMHFITNTCKWYINECYIIRLSWNYVVEEIDFFWSCGVCLSGQSYWEMFFKINPPVYKLGCCCIIVWCKYLCWWSSCGILVLSTEVLFIKNRKRP